MLDTKQLKAQGIRFGRSFQMALRTSVMFTPKHPSAVRPIEQSFQLLNELLKQTGQFTMGFVDNQILINNVLTTEPGLEQLKKEFLKRGIAALTFEVGLTLARYKNIIAVLSASASTIEEAGGIREYLETHEIPGARIVAASRVQKATAEGDTLIESDSEAFILSKQLAEEGPRDFMESLDALLESACLDPASRTAVLAGLNPNDPNVAGRGYGVPIAVPNLVVDRNSVSGTGGEDNAASGPVGSSAAGSGGFGGSTDSFVGVAPGSNTALGSGSRATGSPGYVVNTPHGRASGDVADVGSEGGRYRTFMELVNDSVSRSLVEDNGNPRKSYLALARILKESRLDTVLAQFPEHRREELRTLPPEQLAAEYIEENTLKLIAKQLSEIDSAKRDKFIVEESVLRLLARSLQATHMADRLAFKLAKFFQECSTPPHLQAKIQEELRWTSLSQKQKYARLMEKSRYDHTEFRRLMDLIRELIQEREPEKVIQLSTHYFDFLSEPAAAIEPEELSRSIELIRTAKLGRETETGKIVQQLGNVLMRDDVSTLVHFQAANNLSILSQSASVFEAFDKVLMIAETLRESLVRDPEKHQKCCGTGLSRMLSPTSIDRLIELYIANRSDANFTRLSATILRYSHPLGTDALLKQLIEEKNATNRLALLRLIGQVGPHCLQAAHRYLQDDRWYVVRNMCNLLAELRDPELAEYIGTVLTHADVRVQQAALNSLIKTRAERRGKLIAECLREMAPVVQEQALDELLFLHSPDTLPALGNFLVAEKTPLMMAQKALQVVASINDPETKELLQRIAANALVSEPVRKLASELAARR